MASLSSLWSWMQRHARGIVFSAWLAGLLLLVTSVILDALILLDRAPGGRLGTLDLYVEPGMFLLVTFGALIVARWPDQVMGWLFCLAGLFGMLQWLAAAYEQFAGAQALPLLTWVLWFGGAVDLPAILILVIVVPYLFPSGRLLSRRWRPLLAFSIVIIAFVMLHTAFVMPLLGNDDRQINANPTRIAGLDATFDSGNPLPYLMVSLALLGSVASLGLRYRRSHGEERVQIRWLLWMLGLIIALALVFLLVPVAAPSVIDPNDETWTLPEVALGVTILLLISFGLPIVLGLSILRYRLYSIDLIVNRTLVYAGVTICIATVYVIIVGWLGATFPSGGNLLLSLLATATIAVFFQPLRERIQRGVNRLLYGERDEPYAVLTRLGRRLESTLAPDAVLPTIVETVREALKLPYVAVALQQGPELVTVAAAGTPVAEPLRLPLVYQQEPVGALLLTPRAPGEEFGPADLRLLDDLARQAGIAAHAVQLNADLQRSRERLVAAREEERRRLRRDLHDGLGPMLGSLTLKLDVADDVLERDPAAAHALLRDLKAQAQAAIGDIRRLVYALRPPALDDLGLVGALRKEATQAEQAGISVAVQAPDTLPSLPAAVEVAAYRITQEALTNVGRHAVARSCTVRLTLADAALEVEVSDDGVGVSAERAQGVGLLSMRERAEELGGTCAVESLPGGGTRVRAVLPLPAGNQSITE